MTPRKTHLDALAISLLLACCLFWGFQQVLIKATIAEIPPMFQASLRLIGATALLWLWCLARGVKLFERDGSLGAGLLAGTLFGAEFACIYLGLQFTSASRLTVFLYTSPFWVALLVPLWVRSERLRGLQWLGLVCAFAAVAYALREGFVAGSAGTGHGDLLGLLAGMLWGLTTVVIRATRLSRVSAEKLLFYQLAVPSLGFPLLSLALGEAWVWHFSRFAIVSLTLQTAVGAFASYLAWMWMLGHYPATKISVFVFFTPLFALLFGALWLGEAVTPGLLMALATVAAGIVLVNRQPAAAVQAPA
ncbi:DMT family transporter [Polaromonas sp.]|jgi:drug/metabolite transporter (DMT)-like permease|uniref:DMT family transporter n=1 Tax=Polaromonas sp. TaxID=1869339 RepID=UPI002C724277|nr:DMT family transporter [Polaromonas sp.]HQS30315.1 DMT family transporter [Polaromonas sp.]HQS89678.1 DMT family transporter [Polaromonas sp.]